QNQAHPIVSEQRAPSRRVFYRNATCEYLACKNRQPQRLNAPSSTSRAKASSIALAGQTSRLVAVYSYCERPGVLLSDKERHGFYVRTARGCPASPAPH